MLSKESISSLRQSLSLPSFLYENPIISAVAAILVFSTLYQTYVWIYSPSRPSRVFLLSLLRDAHVSIRNSEKGLRQLEKKINLLLNSKDNVSLQEWKFIEHELQRSLLSLDSIQKQGILEAYAKQFPADGAENVLSSLSKNEQRKFEAHFTKLKQHRKLIVDRYLKTLSVVDSKLN